MLNLENNCDFCRLSQWKLSFAQVVLWHDEKILLEEFAELLNRYYNYADSMLCAHNGKEFDFPYIARRMILNGIELPLILQMAGKKPWEIKHLDTMELWKFGDYKNYTSLDLLTAIF